MVIRVFNVIVDTRTPLMMKNGKVIISDLHRITLFNNKNQQIESAKLSIKSR